MEVFTYNDYIYYKKILTKVEKPHILLRDVEEEYQYEYKRKPKKVTNHHDKIFKEVLNNKKEVVDFLNEMLQIKNTKYALNETDIEKYNREFITENFSRIESDIVYKKINQNIFFLIEHQSTIDYSMPYRILKYNIAIMESAINIFSIMKKDYKLPTVYSFVIYTGNKKWNATKYLTNKQEKLIGCKVKEFANFQIIDINNYTQKELIESKSLLSKMFLLEKAKNYEELEEYLQTIVKQEMDIKQKQFMQRLIKYILKDKLSRQKYKEIIKQLDDEKGGNSMFVEIINNKIDEMLAIETRVKRKQTKVKKQESKVKEQESKVKEKEAKIKKREKAVEKAENKIIMKMLQTNIDEKTILSIIPINKKRLEELKKELN